MLFLEAWTDELYLRAIDGSPAVKLSSGSASGALSPDGSAVALINLAQNRLSLLPTREGEGVELPPGPVTSYRSVAWMPDGRRVLFSATDGEGARVFLQDARSGTPRPLTPVGFEGQCPSPDGTRFATRDPKGQVVLGALDGGPPHSVPGHHPDRRPLRWSADGRSLFAYRPGDLPARLYRIDLTTGAEEVVRTLMPPDPAGVWRVHPVVVTPDGRHYAYSATQNLSDLYVYTGLR